MSNVFCPPALGIPVFFLLMLNESFFDVSDIEIVSNASTVYRYRIELEKWFDIRCIRF